MNILLIDDDPANVLLVRALIAPACAQITEVARLEAALEILARQPIDLVLLALEPAGSADALAEFHALAPAVPVLALGSLQAMVERLLSTVAHDLRNPLMSMSLGTDLLLDGTEPLTPTQDSVLRRIVNSTLAMIKLIDRLSGAACP